MSQEIDAGTEEVLTKRNIYRWALLGLCWFGFTLTAADRSTWGPSSLFVGEAMGVSLASLGTFATAYYIGYVISNAAGGFVTDRMGGRLILGGSLLSAGSFMLVFGSTRSAVVGIAVQGMVGLCAGAEYGAGMKLLSSWFRPSEMGKAMGIYTSATAFGIFLANAVVPRLIEARDWTAAYHVFGTISIITGIVALLVARGGPIFSLPAVKGEASGFRALLRNRNLVFVALAGFGGFWGTYGFVNWSNVLMIRGRGIEHQTAGMVVAIFAIVGIFGKPLIGWLSDRMGGARRVPAMAMLALFAVMLIVFGLLQSPFAFFIAAPLLGLGAACYLPMLVALVMRYAGTMNVGTAAGTTNALWQLGSTLVPMAVGTAFTMSGESFIVALATLAIGPLFGLIMLYFVDEKPVA